MKRINGIFLTLALLMVGTLGAWAQEGASSVNTTAFNYSSGKRIQYSMSGGLFWGLSIISYKPEYNCEVEEGATLNISCKFTEGVDDKGLFLAVYADETTNNRVKSIEDKTSVSISYTVPKGKKNFRIRFGYCGGAPFVDVYCKVVSPSTPTQPTTPPPVSVTTQNITGTMQRLDAKMQYSLNGVIVTNKNVARIEKREERISPITTQEVKVYEAKVNGYVLKGSTIKVSCKKLAGITLHNETAAKVMVEYDYVYNGYSVFDDHKKIENAKEATISIPINNDNIKEVRITCTYLSPHNRMVCYVNLEAKKKEELETGDLSTGNFRWNDVPQDKCEICGGKFSGYFFSAVKGSYIARCGTLSTEETIAYNFEPRDHGLYEPVFVKDRIYTFDNGVIKLCWGSDEGSSITIGPNSEVEYLGIVDGNPRWLVKKGTVVGHGRSKVEQYKPSYTLLDKFAMFILGTSYVIEANANNSSVYLLDGSVKLVNKSNNAYTLKPGQVAVASKDGQMKIQKFDVQKVAKKYGIDLSGGTTTTASTKRYDVERAIVKYKVTKGTEEGVMAKCFDNYGQLERRELKMGNQTTLQLTQGSNSYSLDTQAKTYTQVTNAELNFLNMNAPLMQKLNLQKKGAAKVLDRECTIYANSDTEFYVWKGIVLKKVARSSAGVVTTTEATSVELPATVDTKYFKMPNGYKKK